MDQNNSIVRDTAIDTINELINSLAFVLDAMPTLEKGLEQQQATDDQEPLISIPKKQYHGLINTIDSIKAAAETSYAQHARELDEKDRQINKLRS